MSKHIESNKENQHIKKTRILKKEKQDLIRRHYDLKDLISHSITLQDVKEKHILFVKIDKEFSILCTTKFNAYSYLSEYHDNLDNDYYFSYLNHRANRMLKDIDRILFYFDKQD